MIDISQMNQKTSKKTIIIYNDYKDLTIASICAIVGLVALLICASVAEDDTKRVAVLVFVVSVVPSLNYSIKSNKNIPRAILSFIMKVALSFLLVIKLLELYPYQTDKSNQISERKKNWQLVTTGIFSFLIFELIKEHRWKGDFNP